MVDIENYLRKQIETHFTTIGLISVEEGLVPIDHTKETYRKIHLHHRHEKFEANRKFISKHSNRLIKSFANGNEIEVDKIKPRLELVKADTWQSNLFRFASLFWKIPVSEGYGRRMRFLVWDEYHDKLIGIIGLGDAVFNLKVRDELIGWSHHDRKQSLVKLMDAYVLGAVPPYNMLLGGKLIACLVRSQEVVDHFRVKYGETTGIISGKKKHARLVMVTTTSSLGRSSIYNRLALGGRKYFQPIGYTSGWGHFHIPDKLFDEMRIYLELLEDRYASNHQYGEGPNWRLRTVRKVFSRLGLNENYGRHGLCREVFVCQLAMNASDVLTGKSCKPIYDDLLTVHEISDLAKERWLLPRSFRKPEYLEWKSEMFLDELESSLF